jgi:hypothetical protein
MTESDITIDELFEPTRIGAGGVVDSHNRRYWISGGLMRKHVSTVMDETDSLRDALTSFEKARYLRKYSGTDGIYHIATNREYEFIKRLAEDVPSFEIDESQADCDCIEDVQIPVKIARKGKAAMYGYLAAHGYSNGAIATAFNTSISAVRVSLSRYKNN